MILGKKNDFCLHLRWLFTNRKSSQLFHRFFVFRVYFKLLNEKIKQYEFCKILNDANMFERIKGIFEIIKEYGTLPFANLARYAFVAVAIMKSLVRTKHLSEFELEQFMQSLCTVSQDLIRDLNALRSETITEGEISSF